MRNFFDIAVECIRKLNGRYIEAVRFEGILGLVVLMSEHPLFEIKAQLDDATRAEVLAHEIGHFVLGHVGPKSAQLRETGNFTERWDHHINDDGTRQVDMSDLAPEEQADL